MARVDGDQPQLTQYITDLHIGQGSPFFPRKTDNVLLKSFLSRALWYARGNGCPFFLSLHPYSQSENENTTDHISYNWISWLGAPEVSEKDVPQLNL
jgi:hypothetical protein